jgi:hypothetical protein
MPYILCPTCGVRSYVSAKWLATPECPACHTTLPISRRPAERGEERRDAAVIEQTVRDLLYPHRPA